MAFECKILADSIGAHGQRLTTFCVTYPRSIHSEIMTHRELSRNSASSRAIPTEKLIQRVIDDPWIPMYIGQNQKGMQAGAELAETARQRALGAWMFAHSQAVFAAREMLAAGAHKQVVNRIIEPYMWITVILSSTSWTNFFGLRCHKDAEPHFQHIARMMRTALAESTPAPLNVHQWHMPLVDIDGDDTDELNHYAAGMEDTFIVRPQLAVRIMCSVARCARVSYLTHDGRRSIADDVALFHKLIVQEPLHASPAEHVACCLDIPARIGNFTGWHQYRKMLKNEYISDPNALIALIEG